MIGAIDPPQIHHITERLLREIRGARARFVFIDLTVVASVDLSVTENLVQEAVDASRLLGARVILSGLSTALEQRLLEIGFDLGKKILQARDLQHGIELAERLSADPVDNSTGEDAAHSRRI